MSTGSYAPQIFTPFSAISKNRIDWKIQVRVCRKWKTPSNGKIPETLEFLFLDIEGSRIQASVKKMFIDKFESIINEGEIYTVIQFSVLDRPKSFSVADFPFRIMFHSNTYVGSSFNSNIPKSLFQFKKFIEIKDGSQKDDGPLFDVIAIVIDINDSRMRSDGSIRGNKSVQLLLEDLDNVQLQCVLWEPYCHDVINFIELVRNKKDYQIIVIQMCRAKMFRGEVGISNTFHATKIIVDQNLEEIVEFKSRLPNTTRALSFDGSKMSTSSFVSVKEELISPNTIFMTLEELKSSDVPVKAWVVASIAEVLYEKGWCYTSCMKCKRKVKEKDSKFFCEWCESYVIGSERFKIHMTVVDGSSNSIFLMWNDIAKSIIDKSAAEVWDTLIQDSEPIQDVDGNYKDVTKVELPQPVDSIIGKEYLFKVSVESKHIEGKDSVYVVEKYSKDIDMINMHKKVNHIVVAVDRKPCNDVVGDTNWVEDHVEGLDDETFKTPTSHKNGKRVLEPASNDGEESTSSKLKTEN